MIADWSLAGMSLAEWAVLAGLTVVVVDRVIDRIGLSPSANRLREENSDLLRINNELTNDVQALRTQVAVLNEKVRELEKHNLESVMRSLDRHEVAAGERHVKTLTVLGEIRDKIGGENAAPL